MFSGVLTASGQQVDDQGENRVPLVENPNDTTSDAEPGQQEEPDAADKPNDRPHTLAIDSEIKALVGEIISALGNPYAERDQERSDEDLHAQKDMARWAKCLLWMGILQTVLTAVGIFLVLLSLSEARKATKVAISAVKVTEDTARRQLRAYMSLSPGPIKIGECLYIKIAQKNCGQTTAELAQFFAIAKIIKYNPDVEPDFPDMEKEPGINAVQPGHSFTVSIKAPGTETTRDPLTGNRVKFPYRDRLIASAKTGECVYLFAEIKYQDIFGETHGTRACWRYVFARRNLKAMEEDWFSSEFFYTDKNNYTYTVNDRPKRMPEPPSLIQRIRLSIGV